MLDREVVHVDTESDVETKENHLSDRVTTSSPSSSGDDAVVRPERDTVALKVDESVDVWKHKKLHTVHLALKGCKLSFLWKEDRSAARTSDWAPAFRCLTV